MRRLKHPNIVFCFGAYREEVGEVEILGLVLEYCSRGSLDAATLDQNLIIPLERQLRLASDVCSG
jgi:serine/threonine protein kinase